MPEAGFEPAPPKRPELKSGALDHSAIQANKSCLDTLSKNAPTGARTLDLRLIRPALYQLSYKCLSLI